MRLIIAGSRSLYGPEGVLIVKKGLKNSGWAPNEIISGNARGVDKIGEQIAKENSIDLTIFPANWSKYGKAAGFKRNYKMIWYASIFDKKLASCPDHLKGALLAIWDGKSKGTKSIIDLAAKYMLPLFVYKFQM